MTNCIGSIPGFVAPRIAGQIVNSDPSDVSKWRNVWIIAIVILGLETIFYIIFGAGTPQSWNFPTKDSEEKEKEGKRDWFLVSGNSEGSVVHSHWSRINEARLSLVESFIVLLASVSYAIKNQLVASKAPY